MKAAKKGIYRLKQHNFLQKLTRSCKRRARKLIGQEEE